MPLVQSCVAFGLLSYTVSEGFSLKKISFITSDGDRRDVVANPGESIMRAAVNADIVEIAAECGGACACGTCHCYIDDAWLEILPAPDELEEAMLECVIERRHNSRLSCQIEMIDQLDGLMIHLPKRQY